MSKKKILAALFVLIVLFIGYMVSQKNSIDEVVADSLDVLKAPYQIIHKDQIGDKTIVISIVEDKDLNFMIIQEDLFKYESIYSGYMGGFERVMDTFGLLYVELPKQVMDGQLFCFGLLNDASIAKLTIADVSKSVDALISDTTEFTYWRANVSDIKSRSIIINGFNSEGNQLLEAEELLREN